MTGTSISRQTPRPSPEDLDYKLGEIKASNADTPSLRLRFDRIAVHNGKIMYVSVIGSAAHCKQFRAIMAGAGKSTQIEGSGPRVVKKSETYSSTNLWKLFYDADGYASERHTLGYGLVHMSLTSKDIGFIKVMSDRSVFGMIKRSSIRHPMTCPFIFEWMEYAKKKMKDLGYLQECHCYRCDCGVFSANSESLAKIVEAGLKNGSITIPDPPVIPRVDLGHRVTYQPATAEREEGEDVECEGDPGGHAGQPGSNECDQDSG